jgi:hypothetical protein
MGVSRDDMGGRGPDSGIVQESNCRRRDRIKSPYVTDDQDIPAGRDLHRKWWREQLADRAARYAIDEGEGALMGLWSATDTDIGFAARRLGIADVVREYGEDAVRARITELREAGLHFAATTIEAELNRC